MGRACGTGHLRGGTSLGVCLEQLQEQGGQTMAEYAVALSIITITVITALAFMSAAVTSTISNVVGIL